MAAMEGVFPCLLLLLLAALLVIAIVGDIRRFTISNRLNLAIALLALPWWLAEGYTLPAVGLQLGLALAVLLLFALAFWVGAMGGGDVKLLAALALWFTPIEMLGVLLLTAMLGGLLTIALLACHRLRGREGRPQIPYGVAIGMAGLWAIGERFLNHFASS
jgi:prepilin peptidase CpaA